MVESIINPIGIINDGNITGTLDLSIAGYGENLRFRIYVVEESGTHGLILAHAARIKPERDIDRKAILPVQFNDIGQQIWKVVYEGDGGEPVLILNSRISTIQTISRNDAQFIMFVYPAVLKEVLSQMVFVDGIDSLSEPQTDWHKEWLDFTRNILGEDPPEEILTEDGGVADKEEARKWINRVVEEFCNRRSEWGMYIQQLSGETGGIT
jgi:hypothetical protein